MTTLAPPQIDRPETFRQSLLAKHDKCPHSAFLYLKHKDGAPSHPKTRGSVFHLFMQRATDWMVTESEPMMPGEVATELADSIMADELAPLSAEEQDVVRQCAWNWAEATVLDLEALVGTEVDVELEVGGIKVTGRIDRVEVSGSTMYLRDAKTSLHVMRQEETERNFQRLLYSLAVIEGTAPGLGFSLGAGITDVWFTFEYPRHRTDEGPLIMREAGSTRYELSEFRRSLERNVAALERSFETDEWPAVPGSWCSECPAQSECPIPMHLRPVLEIESAEDARDAFAWLQALDRMKAPIQSGLRGWVKEHETPVYLGDYAFDAAVTRSTPINKEAVEQAARTGERIDPTRLYAAPKTTTKYARRKITREERDARPS
jgi:RecB family exonuclease